MAPKKTKTETKPVLRLRVASPRPGKWATKREVFGVVVWVGADNVGDQGIEQARLCVIAPEHVQMKVQSKGWDTGEAPLLTPRAEPAATLNGEDVPSHAHLSWVDLPPASDSGIPGPRADTRVLFIFPEPGRYTVHAELQHQLADTTLESFEIEVPPPPPGKYVAPQCGRGRGA